MSGGDCECVQLTGTILRMCGVNRYDIVNIASLFCTADLTDSAQRYIYFIILPIFTIATAVKYIFLSSGLSSWM